MEKKPAILELDYETSPALGYFFGYSYDTNIIEVVEYEQILCVGWMWRGNKTVSGKGQDDFSTYRRGKLDDRKLIDFFMPMMNKADIIVAHNGKDFDFKVFKTRLLFHKLPPPPDSKIIDTKTIAKANFHLPNNRMDTIAHFLGIERKLEHTGKNMWLGCMQGKKQDWRKMKMYNKRDVVILDKVLERTVPFMKQWTCYTTILDDDGKLLNCANPACLSTNIIKTKRRPVKGGWKWQYQCQVCASYFQDTKLNRVDK